MEQTDHLPNPLIKSASTKQRLCCLIADFFCPDNADVIVLIQDSQGISSATVENIKTAVKRMLTGLTSETTDFNFAVAKYATSRRISCFGTNAETISYIDNEYQHGGSGHNLLNLALRKMVSKNFDKRPEDRKTDRAQVSFTSDFFRFGSNCLASLSYVWYLCLFCFYITKFVLKWWKTSKAWYWHQTSNP